MPVESSGLLLGLLSLAQEIHDTIVLYLRHYTTTRDSRILAVEDVQCLNLSDIY